MDNSALSAPQNGHTDLEAVKARLNSHPLPNVGKPSDASEKRQKRANINDLAPGKYVGRITRKYIYESPRGDFFCLAFDILAYRDPGNGNLIRRDYGNCIKSYCLADDRKIEEVARIFKFCGLEILQPSDIVDLELPQKFIDFDIVFYEQAERNFIGRVFVSNQDYEKEFAQLDAVRDSFSGQPSGFVPASAATDAAVAGMKPPSQEPYSLPGEDDPIPF